jgi:hypothetical protein
MDFSMGQDSKLFSYKQGKVCNQGEIYRDCHWYWQCAILSADWRMHYNSLIFFIPEVNITFIFCI